MLMPCISEGLRDSFHLAVYEKSDAGSRNPKRCAFHPGSRSSKLHRLVFVESIYPGLACKQRWRIKQSGIYLATLVARNSLVSVGPLCIRKYDYSY